MCEQRALDSLPSCHKQCVEYGPPTIGVKQICARSHFAYTRMYTAACADASEIRAKKSCLCNLLRGYVTAPFKPFFSAETAAVA